MASQPEVLVLPQVPHRGRPEQVRDAIEDRIPDVDIAIAADYGDSLDRIANANVVVCKGFTDDLLDCAANLEWVQALSAGMDSYNVERLEEMDVVLTNASGVHANPIAEQVIGYMLLFERNIHRGLSQQRRREWTHYTAGELGGKTLGVVGVGDIGRRIAELGAAFDMTVLGTKRDADVDIDAVDELFEPDRLHSVLGRADYLAVACPLTEETRGLIGAEEFMSMKSDAVLVNIARGAVVDEAELTTAIQKGRIGGAALDVQETEPLPQDSPLWNLSNVVITPHMGGATPHYWERCAEIFAENYEHFVEGDFDAFTNRVR